MWVCKLFKLIQMANKIWTRNYWKTRWPRFYSHISSCELKIVSMFLVYQAFEQVAKKTTHRHVYIVNLWYLSKQKCLFRVLTSQLQYLEDLRYAHMVARKMNFIPQMFFYKDHLPTNNQLQFKNNLPPPIYLCYYE